jgi:PhzF family phenazine biosynthesis protein
MSVVPFHQVDVFAAAPWQGNPVAVVHAADGLDPGEMQAVARWTNLSETTFLLRPTDPEADYRVRIFTPAEELPFAGHPTLGSAHAWLEAGGRPSDPAVVVQECGVGRVRVRTGERLAFEAPPLSRSGPLDDAELAGVVRALGLAAEDVVAAAWVCNGPPWVAVRLASASDVLAVEPVPAAFGALDVGVVGPHPPGSRAAVEVRAFFRGAGLTEDPATGSLNAGIAQWLTADGTLPASYVAAQGTALGRAARIHVDRVGDTVWVGGDCTTRIVGEARIGGAAGE